MSRRHRVGARLTLALSLGSIAWAEPIEQPADAAWHAYELLTHDKTEPPAFVSLPAFRAWRDMRGEARAAAAWRFWTNYPQDSRRWRAGLDFLALTLADAQPIPAERQVRAQELQQLLQHAVQVPSEIRREAWRLVTWDGVSRGLGRGGRPRDLPSARRALDLWATEFPGDAARVELEQLYAEALLESDRAVGLAWLERLTQHAPVDLRQAAEAVLRRERARAEPLEMEFVALDGRRVDLRELRGRVVLIEFWATWCVPCIEELPYLLAMYEKFHARGFEIVGVSLDAEKDREKVRKFVRERRVPWPQHFDGRGRENAWAQKFAVRGIPASWLVDRSGCVVATDVRGERLEGEVEGLLSR